MLAYTPHHDDRGIYLQVATKKGVEFVIDVDDRHILGRWNWFLVSSPSEYGKYIGRTLNGTTSLLHREIMFSPQTLTVDHIDGNGLNNRRYNLRLCTFAQNCSSRHNFKRGKSGRRGVYPTSNGRWQAIISIGNVKYGLGTYDDVDEAARAWDDSARQLRGEFTQTNFPA